LTADRLTDITTISNSQLQLGGEKMGKRSVIGVFVWLAAMLLATGAGLMLTAGAVLAASFNSPSKITGTGSNALVWTGQGTTGGKLDTVQCSGDTAAPGTMLWIFTNDGGTVSGKPVLTINGPTFNDGTQFGNEWHFLTTWFAPNTTDTTASVSFDTATTGNGDWVLTISHGWPPAAATPAPAPTGTPTASPTTAPAPGASPTPSPGSSPAPSAAPTAGSGPGGTTGGGAGTSGETAAATGSAAGAPALAATGTPVALALGALVLLVVGIALLLLTRQRRTLRP
jgi:hypothetical protein